MTALVAIIIFATIIAIGVACTWDLPPLQRAVLGMLIGGMGLPVSYEVARVICT